MNFFCFIFIFLFLKNEVFSQPIQENTFLYKSKDFLYDFGEDWQSLTLFSPNRYDLNRKEKNSTEIVLDHRNNNYFFHGSAQFKYKKNYYIFIQPTFYKKINNNYKHNIQKNILFNRNESNYGLGYENSWVIIQLAKTKENWGAGNDIELALSKNSSVYDYFLLGSDYGNFRVRYIYGLLEKIDFNINRYIVSRGFEWTNKKSLIFGFSETVIFSGENRSIEIGYLNPIASHLEVELNNRLKIIGDGSANAVWQFHFDYLFYKKIRFSFNYLYDEFVLDPDIEIGKEHGRAYSIRLALTPLSLNNHLLTLHSSLIYVGSPTFRHRNGTNNFVQDGRPLGWYRGSDGQDFYFGLNYFNRKNIIVEISSGLYKNGEETIINNVYEPYSDYQKGPFPSGNINKEIYVRTNILYQLKKQYSVSTKVYWAKNKKNIQVTFSKQLFKT